MDAPQDGTFNPADFDGGSNTDPFDLDILPAAPTDEVLSNEEKRKALDAWNSGVSDLKKIIEAACGTGIDGRSKKGMAVKKYLADKNLQARPSHVYLKKRDAFILTNDNKEFIANNAGSMKPLEMARVLFDDATLGALSSQFRVVKDYYDTLDNKVKAESDDENTKVYNPPRNEIQALARVNKYVFEGLDGNKLTPRNREALQKLIRFMHTHRYLFEINNLPLNSERELFESSFVRFVHDKPDLTEEEIDLYLNQCSDIVGYQRMQRELIFLTDATKDTMQSEQKVPMALVEAVGKLRHDMHSNFSRQKATLNDLNGKRANRLDRINSSSENVLKLIEAFRDETERNHILKTIEERKKKVVAEMDRLESIESLHCRIFGMSKEEAK